MSEKVEKSFFGLQIITIKSYLWYKSGYIFDHLSNKCIYHILNCRDLVLISMFGLQLNITFWYAIQVRPKSEDIAGHDDTRMWSFSKQKKNHRNVCQIDNGCCPTEKGDWNDAFGETGEQLEPKFRPYICILVTINNFEIVPGRLFRHKQTDLVRTHQHIVHCATLALSLLNFKLNFDSC